MSRIFGELKSAREPFERRWVRNYNAYKGIFPRSSYSGRSNLTPPDLRVLSKRLAPRIDSMTIGRGRFFEAAPPAIDFVDAARNVEDLLLYQMEREQFRRKFGEEFDLEAVIYGTAIAKQFWWVERDNRTRPRHEDSEPVVGDNGPRMSTSLSLKQKEEVSYNGPRAERLDIFRVWFNPYARDINSTDVIEECPVSADFLMRMRDMGLFHAGAVKKALEQGGMGGSTPAVSALHGRAGRQDERERLSADAYTYKEYWGLFPLDAKTTLSEAELMRQPMKQVVIGVVDDTHIVRLEENPYESKRKPYFLHRISTLPGELYGESLVEVGLDIACAMKDTLNQAQDAGTLGNIPMLLADPGHRGTQYTFGMGKVLRGANLRPLTLPDTSMNALRRVEILRRILEDLFAAPPLLSGQELGGEGGATGAAIQDQQAAANLKAYAIAKEEGFLKPFLEFRHAMNEQMLDDDVRIVVMGANGFEPRRIYRDDILGRYDFVMKGRSQQESRERMNAAFGNMAQVLLQIEQVNPGLVNWKRYAEKVFTDVLHIDHPEMFFAEGVASGPVLSPIEALQLVVTGHRMKPDMRQDFTRTLAETARLVQQMLMRGVEPQIQKALLRYMTDMQAAAKEYALRKQQEQMAMMAGMAEQGALGPVGSTGGAQNKPIGPADRDGQGLSVPRQLMKQFVGGA